jgi:hypothetical protein
MTRLVLVLALSSAAALHGGAPQSAAPPPQAGSPSLPCVSSPGVEHALAMKEAGIARVCATPGEADAWRSAGLDVAVIEEAALATREALPVPGLLGGGRRASPTRSPFVVTNGWRFIRDPGAKYSYDLPAGRAVLAAAESAAYGADALLKIELADIGPLGRMHAFLRTVPKADLPPMADFAVMDDGSPLTGEAMNLLTRRNLLYERVTEPSSRYRMTVQIGTKEYPAEEAADPSAFAQKVRRQLTDEKRTLRVYGSEVVIARLTGDGTNVRLHLLNYSGREILGLRVRLLGDYRQKSAYAFDAEPGFPLGDYAVADGATEFSIPRMTTYAVIDLDYGI